MPSNLLIFLNGIIQIPSPGNIQTHLIQHYMFMILIIRPSKLIQQLLVLFFDFGIIAAIIFVFTG